MENRYELDHQRESARLTIIGYFAINAVGGVFIMALIKLFSLAADISTSTSDTLLMFGVYILFTLLIVRFFGRDIVQEFKKILNLRGLAILKFFGIIFASIVIIFAGAYLSDLITSLITDQDPSNQEGLVSAANTPMWPLLGLCVIVMAPLVEEYVFRKSIFILCKNTVVASAISILSFGLIHVFSSLLLGDFADTIHLISYSAMGAGMVFAYLMGRKNIMYPIVVHVLWNILGFMVIMANR